MNRQAPIQVHAYDSRTFILRENLCATFEAPFIYLLIGSSKALLIDTGDVADASRMPLAKMVLDLVRRPPSPNLFLLVAHTHRHMDHRAGDTQFMQIGNVQVVGFDLDSVRRFYNFTDWPRGMAELDLGDRTVDVIPTPGHNETEVSFYDRETGLFFSGDFLLPGRLLLDNTQDDLASAERVAAFVKDRPISFVLGGHIEMNSSGSLFPWESSYHPQEHGLQMSKDDLLALPAALKNFNGFYATSGSFTMENSIHILWAVGSSILAVVLALVLVLVRYVRRRRRSRRLPAHM